MTGSSLHERKKEERKKGRKKEERGFGSES